MGKRPPMHPRVCRSQTRANQRGRSQLSSAQFLPGSLATLVRSHLNPVRNLKRAAILSCRFRHCRRFWTRGEPLRVALLCTLCNCTEYKKHIGGGRGMMTIMVPFFVLIWSIPQYIFRHGPVKGVFPQSAEATTQQQQCRVQMSSGIPRHAQSERGSTKYTICGGR